LKKISKNENWKKKSRRQKIKEKKLRTIGRKNLEQIFEAKYEEEK